MKKENYKPPTIEDLTPAKGGGGLGCAPGNSPEFYGCGNGSAPIEYGYCDIGGAPLI